MTRDWWFGETVRGFFRRRAALLVGALLFALAFSVYAPIAVRFAGTAAYEYNDLLFEIDARRVIQDMTDPGGNHRRTSVHPIYVLLVNPLGTLLTRLTGSGRVAAALLTASLGALGVALAYRYFLLRGGRHLNGVALAALFALTASQLLFSTVPDYESLAVCGLLLTYLLFTTSLSRGLCGRIPWVLAGVLCLGVTTTNFVQTLICYGIASRSGQERPPLRSWVARLAAYALTVLGIVVVLSLLQKAIYPTSELFFQPQAYVREAYSFLSPLVLERPLFVLAQLLKYAFLINVVAPVPTHHIVGNQLVLRFSDSVAYSPLGAAGVALWALLLAAGAVGVATARHERRLGLGILLCLLFNLALHAVYGVGTRKTLHELFMFTGNFTFLVFMTLGGPGFRWRWAWGAIAAAAAVVIGLNHWELVRLIIATF